MTWDGTIEIGNIEAKVFVASNEDTEYTLENWCGNGIIVSGDIKDLDNMLGCEINTEIGCFIIDKIEADGSFEFKSNGKLLIQ